MNNQSSEDEGMLIGELARKANVSVRTIRFYISEGLLPAPQTRGRFTSYDEDALLRLQVIRYLKDAFLPLREIRDRLAGLGTDEVRAVLVELEKNSTMPQPSNKSSAVDYIDQLTHRKTFPLNVSEPDKAYNAPLPSVPPRLNQQPRRGPYPENWRHYRIAPGVIVLASDSLDVTIEKRLEELLQFASRLFSNQGVKHV